MSKFVFTTLFKQLIKSREVNPPSVANQHTYYAYADVYCTSCEKLSIGVELGGALFGGVLVSCPCCGENEFIEGSKMEEIASNENVRVLTGG